MTRTGFLFGLCTLAAACGDSTKLVSVATTESELTSASCNFGASNTCFDTFNTCIAAANADVAACNDALHACLPPPPQHQGGACPGMDGGMGGPGGPGGPGGHHDGPGGGGLPPPDGSGQPPPLPDGGVPPPHGGPIVSGAAAACHDALQSCLDAAPADPSGCFATERQCIADVLRIEFQERCDAAIAQCAGSTDELCTRITERCTQGVEVMPATCE